MTVARFLFEMLPLLLAFLAIPYILGCVEKGYSKISAALAILACILLIINQTGWLQSLILQVAFPVWWVDMLWTVFNAVVVLAFIIQANIAVRETGSDNYC